MNTTNEQSTQTPRGTSSNVDKLDTNAAFTQYVNVLNRAIGENRDRFIFKQLLSAGKKVLKDSDISAQVYKGDSSSPHDHFTLRFDGSTFDVSHGKPEDGITWKVDEDHVRRVIADPEPFVANPARLDLDWLKARLGLDQ